MIYSTIQQLALQYTVMIGAAYVLTVILAVFIYSSRLYTNRSTLSAVGKAYIPIEKGEVGKAVRKMIVKQLERSAIVAWESRPRDLYGEILMAEHEGILPPEVKSINKDDFLVGTEIRVDPANPPWGDVQHAGWSSPSHTDDNKTPHVQFDSVVAELPHLIEARAVSLTPAEPALDVAEGGPMTPDVFVVEALKRPAHMGLREYLAQLSYLGLVNPPRAGESFLSQYERARFAGMPIPTAQLNSLMTAFAELLAGMTHLDLAIVEEIRAQMGTTADSGAPQISADPGEPIPSTDMPLSSAGSAWSGKTPFTAREAQSSPMATPFVQQNGQSQESLGSVIHRTHDQLNSRPSTSRASSLRSSQSLTVHSDAGSVLRHDSG